MYLISEKIPITLNTESISSTHNIEYHIYDEDNNEFFVGKCFVPSNTSSVTLYINDILKSKSPTYDFMRGNDFSADRIGCSNVRQKFYITAVDNTVSTSLDRDVWFYYHPIDQFLDNRFYTSFDKVIHNYNSDRIRRRKVSNVYPYMDSDMYFMKFTFERKLEGEDLYRYLVMNGEEVRIDNSPILTTDEDYSYYINFSLSDIYSTIGENMYLGIGDYDGEKVDYLCKLDVCPKNYYIQFVGRSGGVMSVGFSGKEVYSEEMERNVLTNYYGDRREGRIGMIYKVVLNSGFLTDDEYSVYRDIFSSKYVNMYSVKEDRLLPMIVTNNSYVKRSYRNDGLSGMVMTLELEYYNRPSMY